MKFNCRSDAPGRDREDRTNNVVLVLSVIPNYRQSVMSALALDLGPTLQVYTGKASFDPTVRLGVTLGNRLTQVRNSYLVGRRLLWQRGVFVAAVRADVAILELNPRILSAWAIAVCRRLRRRPTVLWGHAWPRKGQRSWTGILRRPMWALADVILAYTVSDAADLRKASRKPVVAAPNALYESVDAGDGSWRGGGTTAFLFVGRLIGEKKPSLLVNAFALAVRELGPTARLILVGDGPLRKPLEQLSEKLGVRDVVEFWGELSGPADLRPLYERSLASVSPGYAGLSLTQSLWFGVPMVIARDEPHAPEISMALDGDNVVFVESDSADQLAAALVTLAMECDSWIARRPRIATDCVTSYSVDAMASGILAAIDLAQARRSASAHRMSRMLACLAQSCIRRPRRR